MLGKRVSLYMGNIEKSYRHVHEAVECYLVIKGELEIEVEDELVRLSRDDMLVININQVHLVKGNKKNLILCLRIEKEYIQQECRELLNQRICCNSTKEREEEKNIYYECKRLLTRLLLVYTEKRKGYELEFKAVFYLFLSQLASYFSVAADGAATAGVSAKNEPLEEVLQYIRRHYNQDISLEEMAAMAHLSPPYFSKYFKQRIGIGFLEYVTKIRLDRSLQSLLYTDQSILKIAMEHGFANQKSFSEKFRKEHGENPSEYRKKYQNPADWEQKENIRNEFDIYMEEGLISFLKYIHQHDTEDRRKISNAFCYTLDLGKKSLYHQQKCDLIINVETIRNLQNPEIIEQLQEAGRNLKFTYIYFRMFHDEHKDFRLRKDSFAFYDLYQIISRIQQFGYIPFIQIDYADIRSKDICNGSQGTFVKYLKSVFRFLGNQFSAAYVRQWKVEVICSDDALTEEFCDFYQAVYRILYHCVGTEGIGILALKSLSGRSREALALFLAAVKLRQCVPGFFSFWAYPDDDLFHAFREDYQAVSGYYNNLISEIKKTAASVGCKADTIFMTRWNTLAGRNLAESGTFFRASLIVDVFRSISSSVSGIGMHLNTYEVSREQNRTDTAVLALFLFKKVKRPVFFIAEALYRVGDDILYQDERALVTQNEDGEYAVLLSHPCYVNPANSIDPAFLREQSTQMTLELKGLMPGHYQIKTFYMDQEGSGVFNRWENVGFPDFMDRDVGQYLEFAVIPELKVEDVAIENIYRIKEDITFNGVILKLLKRI